MTPQTAGGLLISVAAEDAPALLRDLQGAVPSAQRIGTVAEYAGGKADYSPLIRLMAVSAASMSASVLANPRENRTVPRGNVPRVL